MENLYTTNQIKLLENKNKSLNIIFSGNWLNIIYWTFVRRNIGIYQLIRLRSFNQINTVIKINRLMVNFPKRIRYSIVH